MARSRWKLCTFSKFIWKNIKHVLLTRRLRPRKVSSIRDRSSNIPRCFRTKFMRVHKGKFSRRMYFHIFTPGFKFGEFGFTRKPYHFPLRKMKQRKNILIRK